LVIKIPKGKEKDVKKVLFVLGGNDGEMEVIKNLLSSAGVESLQPIKGWGQKEFGPSDLGLEPVEKSGGSMEGRPMPLRQTLEGDPWVVFVECGVKDWPADAPKPVLIDHHFARSGESASLTQVIAFIRRLPEMLLREAKERGNAYDVADAETRAAQIETVITFSAATARWMELVAANDARYIPGMLALGATQEEIDRVRAFDRAAQGITPAQEAEGLRAIGEKEVSGRLTVVRMAHSKTACAADRLFGEYDQLLILSGDGEVNFFGDGALCAALKEKFEGWNGGSGLGKAGETAYWGGYPNQEEVLAFISQRLQ
jgi:hypothetical protein